MITPSKKLRTITSHHIWPEYCAYIQSMIDDCEAQLHSPIWTKPTEQKIIEDESNRKIIKYLKDILNLSDYVPEPEKKSASDIMGW